MGLKSIREIFRKRPSDSYNELVCSHSKVTANTELICCDGRNSFHAIGKKRGWMRKAFMAPVVRPHGLPSAGANRPPSPNCTLKAVQQSSVYKKTLKSMIFPMADGGFLIIGTFQKYHLSCSKLVPSYLGCTKPPVLVPMKRAKLTPAWESLLKLPEKPRDPKLKVPCDLCDQFFVNEGAMSSHRKTHKNTTGAKPKNVQIEVNTLCGGST